MSRMAWRRVIIQSGFGGDFAADHDEVALGVSLTSHAAVFVLRQARVQHRVGNRVANLVRMAFADGLRGKDIVFAHGRSNRTGLSILILTYHDGMI